VKIAGKDVDLDVAMTTDFGAWFAATPAITPPTPQEDDVLYVVLARDPATGAVYKCNGIESVLIHDAALLDAYRRLDAFGSVKLMRSPSGQAGPGWYAADIADSWSEELFGAVRAAPAAVDVHALATDIASQLVASPSNGLTEADHAAVQADVLAGLAKLRLTVAGS
jgi:hypothetical protein